MVPGLERTVGHTPIGTTFVFVWSNPPGIHQLAPGSRSSFRCAPFSLRGEGGNRLPGVPRVATGRCGSAGAHLCAPTNRSLAWNAGGGVVQCVWAVGEASMGCPSRGRFLCLQCSRGEGKTLRTDAAKWVTRCGSYTGWYPIDTAKLFPYARSRETKKGPLRDDEAPSALLQADAWPRRCPDTRVNAIWLALDSLPVQLCRSGKLGAATRVIACASGMSDGRRCWQRHHAGESGSGWTHSRIHQRRASSAHLDTA
jgi:hypothetical protein